MCEAGTQWSLKERCPRGSKAETRIVDLQMLHVKINMFKLYIIPSLGETQSQWFLRNKPNSWVHLRISVKAQVVFGCFWTVLVLGLLSMPTPAVSSAALVCRDSAYNTRRALLKAYMASSMPRAQPYFKNGEASVVGRKRLRVHWTTDNMWPRSGKMLATLPADIILSSSYYSSSFRILLD